MSGRNLVVGSDECKLKDIVKIIRSTPPENFSPLHEKWATLALELDIPHDKVLSIRNKLSHSDITVEGAVTEILLAWMAANKNVTLGVLVDALEDRGIGMNNHASALKDKFYNSTTTGIGTQQPSGAGHQSVPSTGQNQGTMSREHFNKQIKINLPQLQSRTKLYPGVIACLSANDVLSEEGVETLKAERTESARNGEFYNIIKAHGPGCYDHLLEAFSKQTGVLEILRTFKEQ